MFYVDWEAPSEWTDESETMVLNRLFRILQSGDDTLADHICTMILNAMDDNDWIEFKLDNDEKLDDWSRRELASALIYARKHVKLDTISDIIETLKQNKITDKTFFKISKKRVCMDRSLYKHLLLVVASFSDVPDLLRFSCVSRHWHSMIMNKEFGKSCLPWKTQTVSTYTTKNHCQYYSSKWYFSNVKVLNVSATSKELKKSKFPEFDCKTMQYLNSSTFHCKNYPPELKAVQYQGDDETLTNYDYDNWNIREKQKTPLKLIVFKSTIGCVDDIGSSEAVLFHCSRVTSKHLAMIGDSVTKWICYQHCALEIYADDAPEIADTTVSNYHPTTQLNIIRSGCDITFLGNGSLYDKHVSHLKMVMDHKRINEYLGLTLSLLANVTNVTKPKSIVLLFHYDDSGKYGSKEQCCERDSYLFSWTLDNAAKIASNPNIAEFVVGILYTRGWDNTKSGHLTDLKTEKQHILYKYWNMVLYCDEFFSPDPWEEEFAKIESSMPAKTGTK